MGSNPRKTSFCSITRCDLWLWAPMEGHLPLGIQQWAHHSWRSGGREFWRSNSTNSILKINRVLAQVDGFSVEAMDLLRTRLALARTTLSSLKSSHLLDSLSLPTR